MYEADCQITEIYLPALLIRDTKINLPCLQRHPFGRIHLADRNKHSFSRIFACLVLLIRFFILVSFDINSGLLCILNAASL